MNTKHNDIEIKHIHADVGLFNGRLYFLIKDRLLLVEVGTPHFNDYNEWRISEVKLAKENYNPNNNTVELRPYKNVPSVYINENDFKLLDLWSNGKYPEEDFIDEFEDGIHGVMFEGFEFLTIILENGDHVKLEDWHRKSNEEKTWYEKISYPILEEFRKGWLNRRSSGA